MIRLFPKVSFFPAIGNIQDSSRLNEVLERHSPTAIFHAAAYKHVPMMKMHVFEAITNNVFGTYPVVGVAGRHGVEDFMMISTD